jgi:pantothenate kinase
MKPMSDLLSLSVEIQRLAKNGKRVIVAIAGSPGSGKSTLVTELLDTLDNAVVIPMDGFHLDNVILQKRGLMPRKGSPASFDVDGYINLISRLKRSEHSVFAPIFDRPADQSRAGAIEVSSDVKIVITEGNYLLLDQSPWEQLTSLFDLTVFLEVPSATLRERLINRWLDHGLPYDDAVKRAESNDLKNARLVEEKSKAADVIIKNF